MYSQHALISILLCPFHSVYLMKKTLQCDFISHLFWRTGDESEGDCHRWLGVPVDKRRWKSDCRCLQWSAMRSSIVTHEAENHTDIVRKVPCSNKPKLVYQSNVCSLVLGTISGPVSYTSLIGNPQNEPIICSQNGACKTTFWCAFFGLPGAEFMAVAAIFDADVDFSWPGTAANQSR